MVLFRQLSLASLTNHISISGPIPREFGNLSNLVHLYLNSNELSGTYYTQEPNKLNIIAALNIRVIILSYRVHSTRTWRPYKLVGTGLEQESADRCPLNLVITHFLFFLTPSCPRSLLFFCLFLSKVSPSLFVPLFVSALHLCPSRNDSGFSGKPRQRALFASR